LPPAEDEAGTRRAFARRDQRETLHDPIWKASEDGWQPEEGATRSEVRVRRTAICELSLPNKLRSCLHDPCEFLDHDKDVFEAVVAHLDDCPDDIKTSWFRRTVPDAHHSNRSR
jgi:hypothetical protein